MKKNYLAIILGIALIATMLGGCSQDDATVVDVNKTVQNTDNEVFNIEDVVDESNAKTSGAQFEFSTTDIDGNPVSLEDFADAKLIMVNFWEPWCGPCVGEMPDLEKLYEEYSSEGLVILGIFSSDDMDDDAREVMDSCGTTYPILRYKDSMESFVAEYIPTTFFIDNNGNVLTDEPIVGSRDYDEWKIIIEEYMSR